jgi:hypothetical protein
MSIKAYREKQRSLRPKRTRYVSSVGLNFIDAYGLKNMSFQLCTNDVNGHYMAMAIVDVVEGDVVRCMVSAKLRLREDAVKRLALIHFRKCEFKPFNYTTGDVRQ